MLYTSAEANKLLRQLNEDLSILLQREEKVSTFNAASNEDPDDLRPDYDYRAVQAERGRLENQIRRVKHAINIFNSTQTLPGVTITDPETNEERPVTIDEVLILLPQLNAQRRNYYEMQGRLPRERVSSHYSQPIGSGVIDYIHCNYDPAEARADFNAVTEQISRLQIALDNANQTIKGVEIAGL